MGKPTWITPAGDLGKIQEANFYSLELSATDVDGAVIYNLQAGQLPSGLRLASTGIVEGLSTTVVYAEGVPSDVGEEVTSTFTIRITSVDGYVNDRTFSLTVVGQDDPVILTAGGLLGTFVESDRVDLRIDAFDEDRDDTLTYSVIGGELPPGLSINNNGELSGWVEPQPTASGTAGYDSVAYDINPFDNSTISINRNYEFTIAVNDGKTSDAETYQIFVYSSNTLTADTDVITADSDVVFADRTNVRRPILTTLGFDFGDVRHDNNFAFQFQSADFDNSNLLYEVEDAGLLPPGLVLDPVTGYLYGTLPNQVAQEISYTFRIRVVKAGTPTVDVSNWETFTMNVIGDADVVVDWLTPTDLGRIAVGEVSTLRIQATNTLGLELTYTLDDGRLPQGLQLSSDGLIVGRASFRTFMIDGGTTTFDAGSLFVDETTWERVSVFTVRIQDSGSAISTTETFTLEITPEDYRPYENLWIKAYPSLEQRQIWSTLINDATNFPDNQVYRSTDYNFGKQTDLRFITSTGLSPQDADQYVAAMSRNHYNKRIRLGELKKARAVSGDDVIYEVVYLEVLENESTPLGSVADSVDFRATHGSAWQGPELSADSADLTADNALLTADANQEVTVYPASFENMNSQIVSGVGQDNLSATPLWMRSKQEDGTVPGLTRAVVIAYLEPGFADEVIFNINRRTDIDLKQIEFIVDRYLWDINMSDGWDKTTQSWTTVPETTFDNAATRFDGGDTKFFAESFEFPADRDTGDQFLKFPRENIWA